MLLFLCRLIFWVDMVKRPRLERSSMDGIHEETLFKMNFLNSGHLAIDFEFDRLYWADGTLKTIESSDLSGGQRKILVATNIKRLGGMVVLDQHLYWMEKNRRIVNRVEKTTGKKETMFAWGSDLNSDMVLAYTLEMSDVLKHLCGDNNGGCSHICIAKENNTRCSCSTDQNLMIRSDKFTCVEPPVCSSSQFMCLSGEIACIPQAWWCDGAAECSDSSDEKDCHVCESSQFQCNDRKGCVDNKYLCDGTSQCSDNSDELYSMCILITRVGKCNRVFTD